MYQDLLQGKELNSDYFLSLYKKRVQSDDARFKGIILDGIPSSGTNESSKYENEIEFLDNFLQNKPNTFRPVVLHLSISDEDLENRRNGQWIDPTTGILYSSDQIAYSKRRHAEGWVEGTPDKEAEEAALGEEETWNNADDVEGSKPTDDNQNEEGNEDTDEVDGDEENENRSKRKKLKRKPGEPRQFKLTNKQVWPIVSRLVMDRYDIFNMKLSQKT
jgi:adenylate/nucleoside-diphosphate kinase